MDYAANMVKFFQAGMGAMVALALAAVASSLAGDGARAEEPGGIERGAYLFAAGGCAGCHTDKASGGRVGAGGRGLKTPFGTFYGPNITPDPQTGIGSWSEADFKAALRSGRAADGSNLFPAFPYTSFTFMRDEDIGYLWAYLRSLPPVRQPNRAHDVSFPYNWRALVSVWKWFNFVPGPLLPDPTHDEDWNRGAYLARALLHCGECHTPRNALGGLDGERAYGGTSAGPEGKKVPNITPDEETGLGHWSESDVTTLLKIGLLPDGDVVGSLMGEVVENSTSRLGDADRRALAVYLRGLKPVSNPNAKATAAGWE